MDFLKDILGEELYETALKKINEHNSNEENKDNQIKLGNLAKGEYVAKGKYTTEIDKLNSIITNKDSELGEANKLIDTLKKATKDNDGLQSEIAKYQNEVATLQTRHIKDAVIKYLREDGHTVYDCTVDNAGSQNANLSQIVAKCNSHTADLNISIHLNAGAADKDNHTTGTEVYIYNTLDVTNVIANSISCSSRCI